jgi:site-specific DNA-cytosine methylase
MKLLIDLCSGLGGASEAFMHSKNWVVLRFDKDPRFAGVLPNTHFIDLTDPLQAILILQDFVKTSIKTHGDFEEIVVWASPPCTEFSLANPNRPSDPDLRIVKTCIHVIELLEPDAWLIENVKGAISHFRPLLGEFSQNIDAFFFWGSFPLISLRDRVKHHKPQNHSSANPLRPNLRAYVPMHISQGFLDGLDCQTTLQDF